MEIQELYSIFIQVDQKVSTDSRNITPGSIFFALKGPNFNGNHFTKHAIESGASICIVDEISYKDDSNKIIFVPDVLICLQQLALYHRLKSKATVIAITGSNGKTTTKELTASIFGKQYKTIATLGNLNNQIGVPLTLLRIKEDTEFLILEMGANHRFEIQQLCSISMPDAGLITNIGMAHLEGFGNMNEIKLAKNELFDFLNKLDRPRFYNLNDTLISTLFQNKGLDISYGTISTHARFTARKIVVSPSITCEFFSSKGSVIIQSSLSGDHNFQNIIGACTLADYYNVEVNNMEDGVAAYIPVNMRSEKFEYKGNFIYLDAYNANPTSMHAAILDFLTQKIKIKWLILGEMAELGEYSESEHTNLYLWTIKQDIGLLIFIGDKYKQIVKAEKAKWFSSVSECKLWLNDNWPEGASIFIKGSRLAGLEKLVDKIY